MKKKCIERNKIRGGCNLQFLLQQDLAEVSRFKEKTYPPQILCHLRVELRLAPERCGERDGATGPDAKSATTGQRNIIRVRVHQPGKQKDIYIHKAHLLNMIVFVDIKIVDTESV